MVLISKPRANLTHYLYGQSLGVSMLDSVWRVGTSDFDVERFFKYFEIQNAVHVYIQGKEG